MVSVWVAGSDRRRCERGGMLSWVSRYIVLSRCHECCVIRPVQLRPRPLTQPASTRVKVEFVKPRRFRKTSQPAAQCTELSGEGYSSPHARRPMVESAIVIGPTVQADVSTP